MKQKRLERIPLHINFSSQQALILGLCRRFIPIWTLTALFLLACAPAGKSQTGSVLDNRAAYLLAIAPGSTPADVDNWLASLPTFEGFYLVEGDLLYTEQQARMYISVEKYLKNDPSAQNLPTRELIMNKRPDGLPDYYKDRKDRVLTYAIERSSFSSDQYKLVVDRLLESSKQWTALCPECGIQFVYEAEADVHPEGKTNFVVKFAKLPKGTLALSFFPSDPPKKRILRLGAAYFTSQTYDPTGALRHELGHILGYRHEHIRNDACVYAGYKDEGNNPWVMITAYDPNSVMHYLCAGAGSPDLQFTQMDITGHRQVYAE